MLVWPLPILGKCVLPNPTELQWYRENIFVRSYPIVARSQAPQTGYDENRNTGESMSAEHQGGVARIDTNVDPNAVRFTGLSPTAERVHVPTSPTYHWSN